MTCRLLAFDLDGTLLDSRLQVREQTREAIERLRARGVEAMIVTGRHHVATYAYWHALGLELPAICCNGAYIYDFAAQRALAGDALPRDAAREVLRLARRYAINAMVYVHDYMAFETPDAHLKRIMRWSDALPPALRARSEQVASLEELVETATTIWKLTCACADADALRDFEVAVADGLGLGCVRSSDTRLDVACAGNSKGSRLAEWIAARGIAPAEVIAFGDHDNDIEMLHLAGVGVAMGNAHPRVQACADWVTGSSDGAGITDALERFVLTADRHPDKMPG